MIDYKIVKITDLGTVNRGKSKHRPRNISKEMVQRLYNG